MPSARPAVRDVDHVSLVVADVAVSRRFYVDLLGMEEVPRPDFDFDGAWFRAGGTLVHLIATHERSGSPGINESDATGHDGLRPPREKTSRWTHLAFRVDALDPFVDEVAGAGTPILTGPKRRPDGVRQLFLLDPDGHIVELTE